MENKDEKALEIMRMFNFLAANLDLTENMELFKSCEYFRISPPKNVMKLKGLTVGKGLIQIEVGKVAVIVSVMKDILDHHTHTLLNYTGCPNFVAAFQEHPVQAVCCSFPTFPSPFYILSPHIRMLTFCSDGHCKL